MSTQTQSKRIVSQDASTTRLMRSMCSSGFCLLSQDPCSIQTWPSVLILALRSSFVILAGCCQTQRGPGRLHTVRNTFFQNFLWAGTQTRVSHTHRLSRLHTDFMSAFVSHVQTAHCVSKGYEATVCFQIVFELLPRYSLIITF